MLKEKFEKDLIQIVEWSTKDMHSLALDKVNYYLNEVDDKNNQDLYSQLNSWKAWIYLKAKDFNKAIDFYNIALENQNLDIDRYNIITGLTKCHLALNNVDQVVKVLEEEMMSFEHFGFQLNLMLQYDQAGGKLLEKHGVLLAEIIKKYGIAIELDSNFKESLHKVGEKVEVETRRVGQMDEQLRGAHEVEEGISILENYLTVSECEYYKIDVSEQLKGIKNYKDDYRELKNELKLASKEQAIGLLQSNLERDLPVFYKRLIRKQLDEL